MAGIGVLGDYAGFTIYGWQKGKDSLTPLVYLLVAYLLGLFTARRRKDESREHVDSVKEQAKRRKTIKFWVEIAGVILLAIYAGFTIAGWWISNQQLKSEDRAWIKISEETITLENRSNFRPLRVVARAMSRFNPSANSI